MLLLHELFVDEERAEIHLNYCILSTWTLYYWRGHGVWLSAENRFLRAALMEFMTYSLGFSTHLCVSRARRADDMYCGWFITRLSSFNPLCHRHTYSESEWGWNVDDKWQSVCVVFWWGSWTSCKIRKKIKWIVNTSQKLLATGSERWRNSRGNWFDDERWNAPRGWKSFGRFSFSYRPRPSFRQHDQTSQLSTFAMKVNRMRICEWEIKHWALGTRITSVR